MWNYKIKNKPQKMYKMTNIYKMYKNTVQKRVIIAGLILRKAYLQGWPLAWHLETWISGGFLPFPDKNGSLCLNYLCKQYSLCKHLVSFWYMLGRGCLHDQSLIKNPKCWASNELFWYTAFHTCHSSLLGGLNVSCVTTLGEEACPWFSLDLTLCAFSLCHFLHCILLL